jgi:hypothetical protein
MQAVVVVEQALEIRQVVQAQVAAAAAPVAVNLELLFQPQEMASLVQTASEVAAAA